MTDPKPPRLRRCPFCGGKAEPLVIPHVYAWVECRECGARAGARAGARSGDRMGSAEAEAEAERAWNKRVEK